ncbi:putative transcriptional regulator, GntR family [Candidatus Vecturithrix granuli]|uniref:Putative transcriptional regulator, GntR family n=1 Tax=Vecturithrix granuli TaxID=1499967 RepID=A0A081BTR0_VECG1|nr:putative transcriptional regulator, GntR family [Candidatus Vecturithrix granuli]
MDFTHLLADRTKTMGASAIREILKVVSQPGMVSLAGGIPAPESFPMEIMGELTAKVIDKYASGAFQYDLTEGFPPLRTALVTYLAQKGIQATADEIMIASGSQGVLDAVAKVLIAKGDKIAVEAPTYLGALQAFNPYEPEYVRMDTDDDGLIPESLEQVVQTHKVKFIYLVPTFQNPTGRTIPVARRKRIAEIVQQYEALLIEDDPYSALRYRGENLPPIRTFAPEHVLYISTLSKVFAPGLRIGFYVGPPAISRWMVIVKQGVDLHTNTFSQALAAEYLAGSYLDQQLPKIVNLYRPKQEAMLTALDKYFPNNFMWSKPEGGMFIWAEGPQGIDAEELYWKAIEKKVAFVPGKYFYTQPGEGLATMRLNYTMSDEATIDRAIKTLSEVIVKELR